MTFFINFCTNSYIMDEQNTNNNQLLWEDCIIWKIVLLLTIESSAMKGHTCLKNVIQDQTNAGATTRTTNANHPMNSKFLMKRKNNASMQACVRHWCKLKVMQQFRHCSMTYSWFQANAPRETYKSPIPSMTISRHWNIQGWHLREFSPRSM